MERIIENLYESVSEECFEDIVSMVEELLDESLYSVVQRAYDKGLVNPEYWDDSWNREQVQKISNKEEKEAAKRDFPTAYHNRDKRLEDKRRDKSSPYNEYGDTQNSYSPPSKKDLQVSQSKSIGRHFKELAKDVLKRHNSKKVNENIDDIRANLDRERAQKLEDAMGKDRYEQKQKVGLANLYKQRAADYEKHSEHRKRSPHYWDNKYKDTTQRKYVDVDKEYVVNGIDTSKDRVLHSIAKHLRKKTKISESLISNIIEKVDNILEDLVSQVYKVDKGFGDKLLDKAIDAQYGIGKYKREPIPHKPTKNEVGEKKTDMRRVDPETGELKHPEFSGSKTEKEAIEASKFRHAHRTSKERREQREAADEIKRTQNAERNAGA